MKPDFPQTPREQMEARITALLLGELSADEAATVERAIEQDAEWSQLYWRLKRTIRLVREASAEPVDKTTATAAATTAAQTAPLKLSESRRERLLAQFKTVAPPEFAQPKRKKLRKLRILEVAAVLAVLGILAGLMLPALSSYKISSNIRDEIRPSDGRYLRQALARPLPHVIVAPKESQQKSDRLFFNGKALASADATRRPTTGAQWQTVYLPQSTQLGLSSTHDRQWVGILDTPSPRASTDQNLAVYGSVAAPAGSAINELSTGLPTDDEKLNKRLGTPGSAGTWSFSPPNQDGSLENSLSDEKQRANALPPPPLPPQAVAQPLAAGEPQAGASTNGVFLWGSVDAAIGPVTVYSSAERNPGSDNSQNAATGSLGDTTHQTTLNGTDGASGQNTRSKTELALNISDEDIRRAALGAIHRGDTNRADQYEAAALQELGKRLLEVGKPDKAEAKLSQAEKQDLQSAPAVHYSETPQEKRAAGSTRWAELATRSGLLQAEQAWEVPARGENKLKIQESGKVESNANPAGNVNPPAVDYFIGRDVLKEGGSVSSNRFFGLVTNYALLSGNSEPAAPIQTNSVTDSDLRAPKPATPPAEPQPEVQTRENAFSTFSMNVSDVSFRLAAASFEQGIMPDPATVRSEEFINAFDYRDPEPPAGVPIAFAWERARYPFAHNRDLLRFSLKTAAQGRQPGRPLNLVLLLDNSGSMERADRMRIIHEALRVLAAQLTPQDTLSVVTFARTARLWVDGAPGSRAAEVAEQVSSLTPQGGTNLEEAMNLAYQTALRHYLANGINRVVLLTDGAANLGNVDSSALKQKVEIHRKQGIALDCFGIGWEGYNDDLLEVLSSNGDGRYGFLNSPEEAATEFAGQLAGALHVAAADVKVQVEFNSNRVIAYRQIGYAKHQLTKEQFRDNSVDAAEIGAAESGNALYAVEVDAAGEGPLATVRVRYKIPGTAEYREHEWTVPFTGNAVSLEQASPAMRLAATASAFSEWLVSSPYAAEVTPDRLLGYLRGVPEIYGADARPQKLESMIRQAKRITGK